MRHFFLTLFHTTSRTSTLLLVLRNKLLFLEWVITLITRKSRDTKVINSTLIFKSFIRPDAHQSLDPVLVALLKGGAVHLSQLDGVEADELGLDLLQQSFNLPLLPLLHAAIWVRIQTIEVWLARTCRWKEIRLVPLGRFLTCSQGETESDLVPACW